VVPRLVEATQVEIFSRKRSAKMRRVGPKKFNLTKKINKYVLVVKKNVKKIYEMKNISLTL